MEVSIFLLARSQRAPHFIFTFATFHHTRGNAKCALPTGTKNKLGNSSGGQKALQAVWLSFPREKAPLSLRRLCKKAARELHIVCFNGGVFEGCCKYLKFLRFVAKSLCGKKSSGAYERKHCCRSKLAQSIHWLRAGCQRLRGSQIWECKKLPESSFWAGASNFAWQFYGFMLFSI